MTISAVAITYFKRLCSDAFASGWERLSDCRKQAELSQGGSVHPARLAPAYQRELQLRAQAIVEASKETITRFGIPPGNAGQEEWVERATEELRAQAEGLQAEFQRYLSRTGRTSHASFFEHEAPKQRAFVANAVRTHFWDLEHLPPTKDASVTQNFNIQGPVGAIMTGANATATVKQSRSQGDLAVAVDALAKLRAVLATDPAVTEAVRPDLLKQVDQASAELASGQPTLDRVMLWMGGVASVVQAIPAIKPAWEVAKRAMQMIGVSL